ncbi:MAG TPA: glycosyltransferase [Candidatus Binataceae bacterium]
MRILIISLHFPPIGGASSRIMAELSKALHRAGHEVDVLTVKPVPQHPVYRCSEAEMRFVPSGVRVHRVPMGPINRMLSRAMDLAAAPRSTGVHRALHRWTNRCYQARQLWQPLAIPDASVDWLPNAVSAARKLLRGSEFNLVVSLGNPQTCHLAAFLATRGRRCAWVPFYADAWGLDPGLTTRPAWTRVISQLLERKVLKAAAGVVVCTEEMRAALMDTYGIEPARISSTRLSIPDLDAYDAVQPRPPSDFHLVYTGTIYKALQDPLQFFRAAARLKSIALRISFIGTIPEEYVNRASALGVKVEFPGWCDSRQVIEQQKNATMLLVFGHRGSQVMPSKIYEYLAARRPILAVSGDERDLLAPIIREHRRGVIVANQVDQIERALRELIELRSRSQLDAAFDLSPLPQYALAVTARDLMAGIIRVAISKSGPAPRAGATAPETL